MGMANHDRTVEKSGWKDFVLLGVCPAFFGALSVACYAYGGPHQGLLTDLAVVIAAPIFVVCLAMVIFKAIKLVKTGRKGRAVFGFALYGLSMLVAAVGFVSAVFIIL